MTCSMRNKLALCIRVSPGAPLHVRFVLRVDEFAGSSTKGY